MTLFFCNGSTITKPEEIIPFLGGGEKHWRKGRSAYELAHSWMDAKGIPNQVRNVLETQKDFRNPKLVDGHFERETKIPGRGKASQTDLLALCKAEGGSFILGVEGKVDETLGEVVSDWYNGTPNRQVRLEGLVDLLGGDFTAIGNLRYQLLHRSASALLEARNFGVSKAIMLVHSFDPRHAWFEDFEAFSEWLGVPCAKPGILSDPVHLPDVDLFLGWCADRPALSE